MKQKLLHKVMLLLFALIAGSTSVWADSSTLTPTSTNIAPSDDHFTVTYGGGGSGTAWNNSSSCLRLYAKNTITFTSKNGELITQITFTGTVNGNKNGIYPTGMSASVGSITPSTISGTGVTNFSWTYSTGATSVTITVGGSAGNIDLSGGSFVVTYTPVEKTDPTIEFNDGSVRVGKTLDLSTLFDSNSSGAVTYSITAGDSYASIDGSTLTGTAAGSVTVQASQAAAGAFNAKTATATITVTDPALTSIAITTPPTKTEYDEGDLFDATGMVVTATFADASTEDVTALCTWTPDGALTTSDTEVTISYTYNAVTKTATQDITVNAYVQPTEFDINLNNALFGTSYSGSASGITDEDPVIGTLNHVTVTYAGSGNHYINDSQIRFYPNNKLTFAAPAGYVITKIVFTADGTWAATISSNNGTYASGTKTWTGAASSVLFTGSGSSRCDMSKATITLSTTAPITPAYTRTTYVTTAALDFSDVGGLKAYRATDAAGGVVNFAEVGAVPASTPLMLIGTAGTTYNVPVVASASAPAVNMLKSGDGTTVFDGSTFDYILYSDGLFYQITSGTVATTKAYLRCPSDPTAGGGARGLDVVFGDETAINALENATKIDNGAIYDLSGRRVENPTKGIYIMNGKKVIFK